MPRLVIGSVLSGMILMAWGFCFWVISPFAWEIMSKLPDESAVVGVLKGQGLDSGYYFVPLPDQEAMSSADAQVQEAAMKAHREGPLVQIVYQKNGVDPMSPAIFVQGFAHQLLSSFLVGLLLFFALPGLPTFWSRWGFVVLAGVFASVSIQLSNPIWLHHPWKPPLVLAGFEVGGWVLAGLALALVIRPRAAEKE